MKTVPTFQEIGGHIDIDAYVLSFPGGVSDKESNCQRSRCKRRGLILRKMSWQPTPVLLPGESQGQRGRGCYSPQSYKESNIKLFTLHTEIQCLHTHTHTHTHTQLKYKFSKVMLTSTLWDGCTLIFSIPFLFLGVTH